MSETPTPSLTAAAAALFLLAVPSPAAPRAGEGGVRTVGVLEESLVRLAAERLDAALGAVADSTRALGEAYARLAHARAGSPPEAERWLASRTSRGRTTGLRTWPAEAAAPPPFQAPFPAFYSYGGPELSGRVLRQLELFERFAPTVRTAYESFPYSWVYLTTVDDAMLIHPYLPIEEAVNNGTPTLAAFYTAADFEGRAVGWTEPYLDLVGAGLMITASYPVHDGDELLGVMSRDITLRQLAATCLSHLHVGKGSSALIVDGAGLAIDGSDSDLADEIERVNTKAGAAVLHLRTARGLAAASAKDAVPSSSAAWNGLVEELLARRARQPAGVIRFSFEGRRALAAPIERTGWLVVLTEVLP